MNPFFDVPETDKEHIVLNEIDAEFSIEDDLIINALKRCEQLYQTPTYRAYQGIKIFLDNMAKSMATESLTFGRDGSSPALLRMAEKYDGVRQSFKGVYRDLMEEQQSSVRGGQNLAYDQ
jgi:phosphate uptake regulator